MMKYELGFIGAGNMAEAIVRAAIDKDIIRATKIIASDPSDERRSAFAGLGTDVTTDGKHVISESQQVLLAIKPQTLKNIGPELAAVNPTMQVIISIMAGVSTVKIASVIGKSAKLIRVMPNTPLQVACGMAAIALGSSAKPDDAALTQQLFGAAGETIMVDECEIDAITAVSGSGPAYLFYLAEAMQVAAEDLGLGQHANQLVCQTLIGSATLLSKQNLSANQLRQQVTSPGGTTEAAIKHLDANKTKEVFINAIKAAEQRSKELGA